VDGATDEGAEGSPERANSGGADGPVLLTSPATPTSPASPASDALEEAWEAQRREEDDADLAELEAEEQRLFMPPPPPRLSRRETCNYAPTCHRDVPLAGPGPSAALHVGLARAIHSHKNLIFYHFSAETAQRRLRNGYINGRRTLEWAASTPPL
jgi:hypothetical protein